MTWINEASKFSNRHSVFLSLWREAVKMLYPADLVASKIRNEILIYFTQNRNHSISDARCNFLFPVGMRVCGRLTGVYLECGGNVPSVDWKPFEYSVPI